MSEKEEKKSDRNNSIAINDRDRAMQLLLFYKPGGLEAALGTLEVAKDIVKQKFAEWSMRDSRDKGIIVPTNGNSGGLHVH